MQSFLTLIPFSWASHPCVFRGLCPCVLSPNLAFYWGGGLEIPWIEEPGGPQSISLQRGWHDLATTPQQMEMAMAPHSSTLAWKIPWTEEPGRLQYMGLLRVGHNWETTPSLFTFMHWRRKWQPTPVVLPGESQGWGSLVGCCLWGCPESTWLKWLSSSSSSSNNN